MLFIINLTKQITNLYIYVFAAIIQTFTRNFIVCLIGIWCTWNINPDSFALLICFLLQRTYVRTYWCFIIYIYILNDNLPCLFQRHLPVQLIASFIKRMSRLALASPPHGIIIILPMIYNLIKKHPACMALIHRANEDGQKHACGSK